jgi:hypothetical protein
MGFRPIQLIPKIPPNPRSDKNLPKIKVQKKAPLPGPEIVKSKV